MLPGMSVSVYSLWGTKKGGHNSKLAGVWFSQRTTLGAQFSPTTIWFLGAVRVPSLAAGTFTFRDILQTFSLPLEYGCNVLLKFLAVTSLPRWTASLNSGQIGVLTSFPLCLTFISFFFLNTLAKTLSTVYWIKRDKADTFVFFLVWTVPHLIWFWLQVFHI